jgi:hypothetical protein
MAPWWLPESPPFADTDTDTDTEDVAVAAQKRGRDTTDST